MHSYDCAVPSVAAGRSPPRRAVGLEQGRPPSARSITPGQLYQCCILVDADGRPLGSRRPVTDRCAKNDDFVLCDVAFDRRHRSSSLPLDQRGAHPGPGRLPAGACRFAAASPCTLPHFPSAGVRITRHQRGFKRFTRPVFPSPVAARMERAALGLYPGLRTPPTRIRTTHAGEGTGHRARTWDYTLNITSVDLQSGSPLDTCDLVSHVAFAIVRHGAAGREKMSYPGCDPDGT